MAPALDLRVFPATSARRAILTLGLPRFAAAEFEALKEQFDIVTVPATDHIETSKVIQAAVKSRKMSGDSPYEACVWFFGNGPYAPFDEELLGSLTAQGAGFFSGGGVGYDDVDTKWMSSVQAYYANTPHAVTASTATGAMMLILQATRAATQAEYGVRQGWWRGENQPDESKFLPLGQDVEGMQLGIVGMGNIGKQVALRAQAFGMKVVYHNRNPVSDADAIGAQYLSMDELFATSDVISLNCPLTPATRHLINASAFAKMKDGVFLVNTARGPVVDEEALVDALKSGKVCRAGLDVFEKEPIVNPGLLDPSIALRVTVQPHSAARTQQTIHKGEIEILKSLAEFMRGEKPEYAVNSF